MLCSFLAHGCALVFRFYGFGQRPTSTRKKPMSGSANGFFRAKGYPFAVLANRKTADTVKADSRKNRQGVTA
jgi:hypothetical protein